MVRPFVSVWLWHWLVNIHPLCPRAAARSCAFMATGGVEVIALNCVCIRFVSTPK